MDCFQKPMGIFYEILHFESIANFCVTSLYSTIEEKEQSNREMKDRMLELLKYCSGTGNINKEEYDLAPNLDEVEQMSVNDWKPNDDTVR